MALGSPVLCTPTATAPEATSRSSPLCATPGGSGRSRSSTRSSTPAAGFASYETAADGFGPQEAEWYWRQYARSTADLTDPDLAPLLSDRLHTLPPTLVVTAEHDPLRDEGEHLALLLAEAGVEVVSTRYQGQVHGFWRHVDVFPAAEALVRQVAGFLRMHH